MKTIFVSLFLCYPILCFAQEKTVLHGQIFFPTEVVSSINIINLHTSMGTYSYENGKFKIPVRIGDTLLFSSLQYKAYRLPIDKEILKKPWVAVHLELGQTELESVLIQEDQLSGRMSVDVNQVETTPFITNIDLGFAPALPLPPLVERRLYTASSSPIALLINSLNGRIKKLKETRKMIAFENFIDKAYQIMPVSFFVETCEIPEAYIYSFMYYCSEDKNFKSVVNSGATFEIISFFRNKAVAYKVDRKELLLHKEALPKLKKDSIP